MEFKMSLYRTMIDKENSEITLEDYVNKIRYGFNQDAVINARAVKQKGDLEKYKKIKSQSYVVTARGTITSGESKTAKNIKLTGLCEIDVDEVLSDEQLTYITNDPYVLCAHRSIGGDGYVIFFKVDINKMDNAYYSIGEYLKSNYDITADPSAKNINRLRYISYDPDVYFNPKAKKFAVKVEKKNQLPKNLNFLHTDDSLDFIIEQIEQRNIDLCEESYERYVKIGCSIASKYREKGEAYFHKICSFGSKYNQKHTTRDYKGFLRCDDKITIGTLYYYAKEAGLDLYTERTKSIIQRVKISKTQGNPTVESVSENLKALTGEIANEEEKVLIQQLIDSKEDYSSLVDGELTDLERLGNFISDAFEPTKDELTYYRYIKGYRLEDAMVNDIHITCVKNFKDMQVKKEDVKTILYSNLYVKKFNLLKDFIQDHKDIETNNAIQRVVDCIDLDESTDKDFALWAFKRWLVGAVHNWVADFNEKKVCPLVLVLCSGRMGAGKTIFFREMMPDVLQDYFLEGKIDVSNKDSKMRLARSLVLLDNEFGGKSIKENEQFKDMTDYNIIVERVSYGREDSVFKRRAILCGTSNEYNLLKDFTGKQRRILPLNIKSLNYDEYVKIDKAELIMEAYNLLKSGFDWNIWREEDVNYLYDNTQANLDQLPVDDIFKMHFSFEENEEFTEKLVWNQGEIINFFHKFTPHKFTRYDVKHIMDKNFQRIKTHRVGEKTKQGYLFYRKDLHSYEFSTEMQGDECPF